MNELDILRAANGVMVAASVIGCGFLLRHFAKAFRARPRPLPAPTPGETWRMKRGEHDNPWKELPEVVILRTLGGWVEYRQKGKILCSKPDQTTVRAFADVFERVGAPAP